MQHSPLFNSIVNQNHLGLATTDFLKQLTKAHPYFTPAQFYLLQQMQQNDDAYNNQAAKTAVLFNNPHWLHFKLQQTKNIVKQTEAITIISPQNPDNADDTIVVKASIPSTEIIATNINPNNQKTEIEKQTLSPEQLMLAENADNNDDEVIIEKEIAPIKINISIPAIKENALTFEPMHLVDYFASQGIKLSEEVQPADKLGKQLKSFTDWLKTMKKIHVPDAEVSSGISDMVIQTLAAKSNLEGEVVTEAMAEVLTQQGKAAKAIEVYIKLSLLNPSKSAFFAAKIEQLKR